MNYKRLFPIIMPWQRIKPTLILHSDDWGAERMPSESVRRKLDKHPLIVANDPYARLDTLASAEDLAAIFDVLTSVKDSSANPAVLTANVIMANPDYQRIKEIQFNQYFNEPFTTTFEKYNNSQALQLWQEGTRAGIFIPQYHGREHVNVKLWLFHLKNGHEGVRAAFDHGVYGVNFLNLGLRKENFQAAWDFYNKEDEEDVIKSSLDGYKMFEEYFGFQSQTAIAPSYTWNKKIEKQLRARGVKAMQGLIVQKQPKERRESYYRKFHLFHRQAYQLRNVFFEPSLSWTNCVVDNALLRVSEAFKFGRPAIVCSHRLNYVSGLNVKNRDFSLKLLKQFLKRVVKNWPDIEFQSARDLTPYCNIKSE